LFSSGSGGVWFVTGRLEAVDTEWLSLRLCCWRGDVDDDRRGKNSFGCIVDGVMLKPGVKRIASVRFCCVVDGLMSTDEQTEQCKVRSNDASIGSMSSKETRTLAFVAAVGFGQVPITLLGC
jgi:hypothetical protein